MDSGNLAGCLLVVEQACLALPDSPVIRPERWQGLLDTLGLLEASLDELYSTRLDAPVAALRAFVIGLRQQIQVVPQHPQQWAALIAALNQEAWGELSHLIVAVFESETRCAECRNAERFAHHFRTISSPFDQYAA